MIRLAILLCALLIASSSLGKTVFRGMTVSCPRWGEVWASPQMDQALAELTPLGVNSVAIHPYARIERNGQVSFSPVQWQSILRKAASKTQSRDIQLFIKPHLAYWGQFAWRGEISFEQETEWKRFFQSYTKFLTYMAKESQRLGVKLFSIGVEYKKTIHRPEWFQVIESVKKVFHGKLTYSANWDEFSQVPFWKELDYVGIQAYFPIPAKQPLNGTKLRAEWRQIMQKLKALPKPILFTEIGYDGGHEDHLRPWESAKISGPTQTKNRILLVQAALRVLEENAGLVHGVFWWKWMPRKGGAGSPCQLGPGDCDFDMTKEPMRALIQKAWAAKTPVKNP